MLPTIGTPVRLEASPYIPVHHSLVRHSQLQQLIMLKAAELQMVVQTQTGNFYPAFAERRSASPEIRTTMCK